MFVKYKFLISYKNVVVVICEPFFSSVLSTLISIMKTPRIVYLHGFLFKTLGTQQLKPFLCSNDRKNESDICQFFFCIQNI